MESIKRQTAYFVTASQLLGGSYVERPGWEPNYVEVDTGAVSRVRLAGVVVDAPDRVRFLFDDGSGRVHLRFFDVSQPRPVVGVPSLIIGRPRQLGGERVVVVELCRPLPSSWLKYYVDHRGELQQYIPQAPRIVAPESDAVQERFTDNVNKAQILLDAIRELDRGDGAPTDQVLLKANFADAEEKLRFLIAEGEIFELRAGKIKVLE